MLADVEELIVTDGVTSDHQIGIALIEILPESITKCYADMAYDRKPMRKACAKKHITQVIPPIRTAVIRKPGKNDPPHIFNDRNAAIRLRRQHATPEEGNKAWRKQQKYGKRAHVEGFFSRFKQQFGFHCVSK